MGYLQEIDALGRWVFKAAKLKSYRLSSSPPQVTRPVILWEMPNRVKGQNLGNYHYIKSTSQFGKLYVNSLDELARLLDQLEYDVGNRGEALPIYESEDAKAEIVGYISQVTFEVGTSQTLDVPITIRYQATYARKQPTAAPPATKVFTRIVTERGLKHGKK